MKSYTDQTYVLDNLFLNSVVLATVTEGTYQGSHGYAYLVYGYTEHVKIVLISDSYGSCSYCDAWQECTEEDARRMCINLANDAHMFDSVEEAIAWLKESHKDSAYYEWSSLGPEMITKLEAKLEEIKIKGL